MKQKSKLQSWLSAAIAGLALSATLGHGAPLITVDTFDTAFTGGVWDWYGGSTLSWDGTQDHTGDGGGSLYIAKNTSNDHIFDVLSFSGNNWDNGTAYDLTLYTNMTVWIKWDATNSSMSLSDFNANLGGLTMELNDNHLGQYDWSGGGLHALSSVQIPNTASNGWVLLNFPISSSIPYIDSIGSIIFDAYHTVPWSGTVNFWVDDITFQPAAVDIIPPPTIKPPTKAVPGLNIFASTEGNSYYDRQDAELRQTSGLSWVGQATAANPVTYSFTITGYPNSVNCEAWMFLVPNPTSAIDNGPDWNEPNCVIAYLQGSSTSATMHFEYKINEASQQGMYSGQANVVETEGGILETNTYTNAPNSWNGVTTPWLESGNLASVTNNGVLGTWTVKFTSDTNVTLIAPDGNSTNFIFPAYNVGNFAETASPGFSVYLGMQANNADAIDQAVVYSNFAISNTASPFYENFLTDTALDTTNAWVVAGVAGGPLGVLIAPASAAYWVDWTLPASGFSLQTGASLSDLGAWTSPSMYPSIPFYGGLKSQLVDSSELPAGGTAFFSMVKRTGTQLLVLLPGETYAPGSATGKTGTPTPVNAFDPVTVTVDEVDATWHIVNSSDAIAITSSDEGATLPDPGALSNGTYTGTIYFGTSGPQTVTATDNTNTNIVSATSSDITVQ